jgi:transcriptional regulator with XRE-family HTH domain
MKNHPVDNAAGLPTRDEALKELGRRIRQLRKARGWSQEQLATQIDMSVDAVSSVERGKTFASIETLLKIVGVFGVRLVDLFDAGSRPSISPDTMAIMDMLADQPTDVVTLVAEQVRLLLAFLGKH